MKLTDGTTGRFPNRQAALDYVAETSRNYSIATAMLINEEKNEEVPIQPYVIGMLNACCNLIGVIGETVAEEEGEGSAAGINAIEVTRGYQRTIRGMMATLAQSSAGFLHEHGPKSVDTMQGLSALAREYVAKQLEQESEGG